MSLCRECTEGGRCQIWQVTGNDPWMAAKLREDNPSHPCPNLPGKPANSLIISARLEEAADSTSDQVGAVSSAIIR